MASLGAPLGTAVVTILSGVVTWGVRTAILRWCSRSREMTCRELSNQLVRQPVVSVSLPLGGVAAVRQPRLDNDFITEAEEDC